GQKRPRTEWNGAGAGATVRGTRGRRTGAGANRGTGVAAWASAWPEFNPSVELQAWQAGAEPGGGGTVGGAAEPQGGAQPTAADATRRSASGGEADGVIVRRKDTPTPKIDNVHGCMQYGVSFLRHFSEG